MIYLTLFAKSDKTRLFEIAFTIPRLKLQKLAVMETFLISILIWRLLEVSSFVSNVENSALELFHNSKQFDFQKQIDSLWKIAIGLAGFSSVCKQT